jgi:hypothetical protein
MVSPGRSGGAWIFRLGGVFALDQWPFGHGGVGYRGVFGDPTERVTVGWLLEGGLIYGRVGLPIAVRWDSGVVFSTQPAIDLSVFGTLHLPAQVSFPLGEHVGLNVEGGVHAGSVGSGYFETASFTPYLVLGLQHRR